MLIQLLIQQPQVAANIVSQTPVWVWGLLAGLMALGASQLRHRRVGLPRTFLLPVSMTALSVGGMLSALGASGHLPTALTLWALVATVTTLAALAWRPTPPAGTRFDATSRRFELPGSAVPLMLILAIFLTKYGVSVELAMQPQQAQDIAFIYSLATAYGAFNGILIARSIRLWRLAHRAVSGVAAIAH